MMRQVEKNEVVMCLNSPTLPFLPCFITFCSTHSYTSYFYEIFATCYNQIQRSKKIKAADKSSSTSVDLKCEEVLCQDQDINEDEISVRFMHSKINIL